MACSITRAGLDNLPALAEINRAAYHRETIAQFAFKHSPDEENMFEFFKARLAERFSHTESQVFKAADADTGCISGFICLTHEGARKGAHECWSPGASTGPDSYCQVDAANPIVLQPRKLW